jgi:dephospho-CoA kinase
VRIGLTGGVASGKSTVAAILRDLGAVVIDADQLAREVVAPGTPGLAQVVAHFGTGVLGPARALDRAALADIVFADVAERRVLEAIVHPLVRSLAREIEIAAGPEAIVVHEIPLLVETGQQDSFDAVIVVDVPRETQIQRLMTHRGLTHDEAESRITAQATREERWAAATYLIENTGTHEDLRRRVTEVFESVEATRERGGQAD